MDDGEDFGKESTSALIQEAITAIPIPTISTSPAKISPKTPKTSIFARHVVQPSAREAVSHKKRAVRDESEADDLLSKITEKIQSTSIDGDSKMTRADMVAAFIAVLDCTESEATFFLETADWDVAAAVQFWLESDRSSMRSTAPVPIRAPHRRQQRSFTKREVKIEGLDPEWSAWVGASNGMIYFLHNSTGQTQSHVPPGFSDGPVLEPSPQWGFPSMGIGGAFSQGPMLGSAPQWSSAGGGGVFDGGFGLPVSGGSSGSSWSGGQSDFGMEGGVSGFPASDSWDGEHRQVSDSGVEQSESQDDEREEGSEKEAMAEEESEL